MSTSLPKSTAEAQLQILLDDPAGTPPPGVLPNFENPATLNQWAILTIVLGLSLGTICVAIRIYTKSFIMKVFDPEDCTFFLPSRVQLGQHND